MTRWIATLLYTLCSVIAVLFLGGAVLVFTTGTSDDPMMASGWAIVLALLSYGFGWSSRRMLTGQG